MDVRERREAQRELAEHVLHQISQIGFAPASDDEDRDPIEAACLVGLRRNALALLGVDVWLGRA